MVTMHKIQIFSAGGESLDAVEVSSDLLELDRGDQAVHDVIVARQAGRRAGTACTLAKGEVAGSNRKPWRQKGTGRARAGYRQSPVWRGGGVVFGPKPRDYGKKVNRKVLALALRRAFTLRLEEGSVMLVDGISPQSPKTGWMAAFLGKMGISRNCLVLVRSADAILERISRNIPWVELSTASEVDVYKLMRAHRIVMTKEAFEDFRERIARPARMEQGA